jgi:hypothetical protein
MLATPTFAAGVGIIVAAALAYSTTQTHLVFSGRDPACASASCTTSATHGNGGQPFNSSAQREHGAGQGSSSGSGASHGVQDGSSLTTSSGGSSSGVSPAGPAGSQAISQASDMNHAPVIVYKTVKRWPGGFDAAVTLTNQGRAPIAGWQLWLRYQTNDINHVWHAVWFPANTHAPASGLIVPSHSQALLKPGAVYRFEFQANGPAGSPIGCLFNGYHCNFNR